jgi:hypothetical protein
MAQQERELSPAMSWQELSQYRDSLQRLDDERVKELYLAECAFAPLLHA